jgi:hypothetical protein
VGRARAPAKTRTGSCDRPTSILASPRRNAFRLKRHAALFLAHRTLDCLPLFFAIAELRRNVRAAESRRRDPDHRNATDCVAALRLFLLLRRVNRCRVDLLQFVEKVEAIENVVGNRADIGLGDALGRGGASR